MTLKSCDNKILPICIDRGERYWYLFNRENCIIRESVSCLQCLIQKFRSILLDQKHERLMQL